MCHRQVWSPLLCAARVPPVGATWVLLWQANYFAGLVAKAGPFSKSLPTPSYTLSPSTNINSFLKSNSTCLVQADSFNTWNIREFSVSINHCHIMSVFFLQILFFSLGSHLLWKEIFLLIFSASVSDQTWVYLLCWMGLEFKFAFSLISNLTRSLLQYVHNDSWARDF